MFAWLGETKPVTIDTGELFFLILIASVVGQLIGRGAEAVGPVILKAVHSVYSLVSAILSKFFYASLCVVLILLAAGVVSVYRGVRSANASAVAGPLSALLQLLGVSSSPSATHHRDRKSVVSGT